MFGKWRKNRERREADRQRRFAETKRRSSEIVQEVAAPLIGEGLGELREVTIEPNSKFGDPEEWVGIQPKRDGAAPIAIWVMRDASISLGIGEPFPGGCVTELDTDRPGWEDELRECVEAVVEGRYRERVYRGRLGGDRQEMVIELPERELRDVHFGESYGPHREWRPKPYRPGS